MENIEIIKSEYEKKLDSLKVEFSKRIDEIAKESLENKKTAFEVGKWYMAEDKQYSDCGPWLFRYKGENSRFVNYSEMVYNEGWLTNNDLSKAHKSRPATKEEIKEALLKEANRRGFKEGVRINRDGHFHPNLGVAFLECETYTPRYWDEKDRLEIGGCAVYEKGKWAEIIKDEVIKIGGYEAKYSGGTVSFGCKSFGVDSIRSLSSRMKDIGISSIKIEGHEVTNEQVNKILKGFK